MAAAQPGPESEMVCEKEHPSPRSREEQSHHVQAEALLCGLQGTAPAQDQSQADPTPWLVKPGPMDFPGWVAAAENVHSILVTLLGRVASHNFLASAQAILARFGRLKRPIETDLVTLIGVSIALRGDVDNEAQREAWYKCCKVTMKKQKALESMLIMQLPFSNELQNEVSLRELSCF